jgi:hypothetical protein
LDSYSINQVSQLLLRVETGSDLVIQSPLGGLLDAETILSGWDDIFNSNQHSVNDELYTLEMDNRDKFGPRSIAMPWESRKSAVDDYFSLEQSNIPDLDLSGSALNNGRLRPLELSNAMKFLKNSTNSGLPYLTQKRDIKEVTLSNFNDLLDREDPCVLFTRTQESNRTRNVWGYPAVDTLNEMKCYRPLLDYQKKLNWRCGLSGPSSVDRRVTELLMSSEPLKVSIDFSSYDASVKFTLQEAAFNYIKSLFQTKYHGDIDYIAYRFNTIGLITPDGILNGRHGVPSGSTFTNEVDSIAQYLCAIKLGVSSNQFDIQGDDGIYSVDDSDLLFDGFKRFGLKVNEEKSYVSNEYFVYLQNLHHKDYIRDGLIRGIYPTYRALNRIIYPERFNYFSADNIDGGDYFAIRTISILENCRNHPLFKDLVNYVMTLDKFSLNFSENGFNNFIQRIIDSSASEDFLTFHYGDELNGIDSFETVKVLRELKAR